MAHRLPILGFSRGAPRRSLHAILKGSAPVSSTSLNTTKVYYPRENHHGLNIYDHKHESAHGYIAKPVSKFGYRVSPLPISASYNTTSLTTQRQKVAVILSGCGVLDGTEIHEAVSVLVHLSRAGVDAKMFAPDKSHATVNHLTSNAGDAARSVLEESARIARGKVKSLKHLQTDAYSAIIFPGGYGAAKNLCNFAERGENMEVDPEIQRIIKEFLEAKKPIGMLCVSPVIISKLVPGVRVTVGSEDKDVIANIKKLGGETVPGGVSDVVIDEANNVITSPAYMVSAPIHKIFDGIGSFVETVLSRARPIEDKPVETEKKA